MAKSNTLSIEVEPRERAGTSFARSLRRNGKTPAILYGHGKAATPLTLSAEAIAQVLHHAGMLSFKFPGKKKARNGILKETQWHPITRNVLHLDFQEVKADEIIAVTIRIEPHGEPAGCAHGGQLEQMLHEFEVRCLPRDMVEAIVVEVSAMELDDTLHIKDLVLPEGLEPTADPDQDVFQLRLPKIEEEEEEEEEVLLGEDGEPIEVAEGEEDGSEEASDSSEAEQRKK